MADRLIVSDPKIMMEKPVVAGTHITAAEALKTDVVYPMPEFA